MQHYSREILNKVEQQLRLNCPSPEGDLGRLAKLATQLPETEKGARMRRFVLDIDDLIAQSRWHLGQALLLMEAEPYILDSANLPDNVFKQYGAPADVLLLLRGYIREADRIFYDDLSERRRSGTVAGWIFHMMIDSAIYRSFAALDRIAHLLWYLSGRPLHKNGKEIYIYFRSGRMEEIHKAFQSPYSQQLVEISKRPVLEYITSYRNGLTHHKKTYSLPAGPMPADQWRTPDGQEFTQLPEQWDADLLFALGNAAYHQLLDSMPPCVCLVEEKLSSP